MEISQDKIEYAASAGKYELYYGIPSEILNNKTPNLTFKNIYKEIKPVKNKELFNKIIKEQKKYAN